MPTATLTALPAAPRRKRAPYVRAVFEGTEFRRRFERILYRYAAIQRYPDGTARLIAWRATEEGAQKAIDECDGAAPLTASVALASAGSTYHIVPAEMIGEVE